jgi:hypothetical protein
VRAPRTRATACRPDRGSVARSPFWFASARLIRSTLGDRIRRH